MRLIKYWMLRFERAVHIADAYLAEQRGDMTFAADCKCRAWECDRMIVWLELQPK